MTLADVIRPYLWLAAVGFLIGFMTYLAMGRPTEEYVLAPSAPSPVVSAPASASGPASADWNLPKRI